MTFGDPFEDNGVDGILMVQTKKTGQSSSSHPEVFGLF